MDADERLTALKRAYADIILNTAKEAAARIMASERKALRFQQELNVAKEQALQMLLRLKQMMDSKASEAEMTYLSQRIKIEELEGQLRDAEVSEAAVTSLSQQRKIEELEAQLHEAEDIVKDLREELRDMQAELERVGKNKLQHTGAHDAAPQAQTSLENGFHNSQSVVFSPPASRLESFSTFDMTNSAVNLRNEVYNCYNANDYRIRNSYIGKSDLPSTSEENRLDIAQSVIFPPPESRLKSFTASDMKSSVFNQQNEAYMCYSANELRMGNSSVSKPDLPSIVLRSKEPELYRNRRTQRIRAFEEKLMAGELSFSDTIDDANYETSGREDGEVEGICKTPTYKADSMRITEKKGVVRADSSWHQVQKSKVSHRKKRRATICKKSKISSSARYLSNQVLKRDQRSDISCTEAKAVYENAQSGGDRSTMAPRLSADTTDNVTLLKCTRVAETDAEHVKAGSVRNSTNKDQTSTDKLLLTKPVSRSAGDSGLPICRRDVEKVDVPVVNSETKTSGTPDGIPNQPVTDRVIKYTFQRKRKKESLSSSDGNTNAEESVTKKKTAENGPQLMEKSSSIIESSRDSRRVAQVARQLISLSEKKWWQ